MFGPRKCVYRAVVVGVPQGYGFGPFFILSFLYLDATCLNVSENLQFFFLLEVISKFVCVC